MHGQQEGKLSHVKNSSAILNLNFCYVFQLVLSISLLFVTFCLGLLLPPDTPRFRVLQFQAMGLRANQTHKSHPMGQLKVQVKVKVNVKFNVYFVANANGQVQAQVKG